MFIFHGLLMVRLQCASPWHPTTNGIAATFRLFFLLTLTLIAYPAICPAEDVPDIFDPSRARRPVPGDWLEYRIAFPADPLENSLRTDPAPVVPASTASDTPVEDTGPFLTAAPEFEAPAIWRVLPLRVEILAVDDDGTKALLAFAGLSREVLFPAGGRETAEFHYEAPQEPERRETVLVNGVAMEVDVVRRLAENYGFVRYFSSEVPFGIVRFATEDVDLVLVGLGQTSPPAFPLDVDIAHPPLGSLYKPR